MTNILRPLGHTGIMISPIGLGCWQFSKQNNLMGKYWDWLEKIHVTLQARMT